tara:strand:- start:18876 stop:19109 length:234 start_codon:yes stop_codon:yes gene_type:complete
MGLQKTATPLKKSGSVLSKLVDANDAEETKDVTVTILVESSCGCGGSHVEEYDIRVPRGMDINEGDLVGEEMLEYEI